MTKEVPWIKTARELISQKEIPGSKSNSVILEWARQIGGWIAKFYKNDDIPWCGLFVGHCLNANGFKVPPDMLLAPAWKKYGKKLDRPMYGCIAVFRWTNGRQHVGYIIAEDKNYYYTLGGNQSNQVKISPYAKGTVTAAVWPICDLIPEKLPLPIEKIEPEKGSPVTQ